MSEDQPTWAANTGLSEDTARAFVYPPTTAKKTWKREADQQGYASLSRYLLDPIQEARALRNADGPRPRQADQRIQELQSEVERLQRRLEQRVADLRESLRRERRQHWQNHQELRRERRELVRERQEVEDDAVAETYLDRV